MKATNKDIEVLLRVTKLKTVAQVQTVIDCFFPDTFSLIRCKQFSATFSTRSQREPNLQPPPRRPLTARAVARQRQNMEEFGLNLRDWFHELQRLSTRAQLAAAVKVRPPSLAKKIPTGQIADAFLAAQVEFLCRRAGLRPPHWTRDSSYVLDEPWFSVPGRHIPGSSAARNTRRVPQPEYIHHTRGPSCHPPRPATGQVDR